MSDVSAEHGTTGDPLRAALRARLEGLSPEQLAAVQARLRQRQRSADEIRLLPDAEFYPLSLHQRRLWLIEQLQPGTPLYHVTRAVRIRGALDRQTLRVALQTLVDRHAALRTTMHQIDGAPVQRIVASAELQLTLVDLRGAERGREGVESALHQRLTDEGRRSFDLAADLMLRAVLYELGEREHVLQFTLHHLACDGWSLGLLFDELSALYRAFREGQECPLPAIDLRYVDFARWQGEPRQAARLEPRIAWWKRQLSGTPSVLELPTDHPRPRLESGAGAVYRFELPAELRVRLERLGREEQATFYMTLLAGLFLLLHRYTGMETFLVGSATAGRQRPETHALVGFFVDTLVLRADLSGEPTVRQLLRRVRQTVIDAVEHSDVPFERIVETLDLPRDSSRQPLIQVLCNAPPQYHLELDDLELSPVHIDLHASRFDLELTYSDGDNQTTGITWNTDLFERATIRRMAGHYLTLLDAMAREPEQPASRLPLLSAAERHQVLVDWNDTAADCPRQKCLHQLLEEQVERTPDTVAVVLADRQLTYRELNEQANQLAHELRSLGIRDEALVGLALDRSPELVVGILGILKAGGAYLPLDADLPRQRLEFMLADAGIVCLVTQERLREKIPTPADCRTVCVDRDAARLAARPRSNPSIPVGVDQLSYVMYTSGSTGQPKGVAVTHRSVVNVLTAMRPRLGIAPGRRFLGIAAPTFDISVAEVFLPLIAGGTAILVSKETAQDVRQLSAAISNQEAHLVQATPATWAALLESGWSGGPDLTLISTGEVLRESLARRLLAAGGLVWDLYGPTETTIWCTARQVTASVPGGSIGRPIANTEVYVLDPNRQPVPIGVPGELYVGGVGLARGYLNREQLTAERFVAHPFAADPHARLYRSGDRCRWRADGTLEFLGRLDDQVKLRGYRIELGEIEAVLQEHPSVARAVVVLRGDDPENQRLVAYFVPTAGAPPKTGDLVLHLRARLPDYMIPATLVPLETLPITVSGKIDRRALPIPDAACPTSGSGYVPPRSPMEEQLAGIWCAVLGIARVGVHDDFFAHGGHSLLAARVAARVADAWEVELPLPRLFASPTIAGLAAEIRALRSGGARAPATPLDRIDRQSADRMPPSFVQQRLWFLEQMDAEATAYNLPFAWRLRGTLDREALRRALEAVVRRHEPLRTTFAAVDGDPVQVIQPPVAIELPLDDLRALAVDRQDAEVVRCSEAEARQPFDLARDQMLRARLLWLDAEEHVLLITMHHIAVDGWSLGVMWHELQVLYAAFSTGVECQFAEPVVRYADYAEWQRKEIAGPRLAGLLQYWRGQLDGLTALELPTDRPRPPRPTHRGARHEFTLSASLVQQLEALGRAEGATLHMTLLAAFQTLLSRYSGQDDVTVGIPIAGRDHLALEPLIGCFVNTIVLRTDLSGNPTFRQLLERVRQVSLAAYDHQALPFEMLVDQLRPERQLGRNPLFQVLFQLTSFGEEDLALPPLEVARLPARGERARVDLEVHLRRKPNGVHGTVVYSTDLFDSSTIDRMVEHFATLLEAIAADANQRISELSLLTARERQQVQFAWNNTAVEYPREKCIPDLFEAQAERTPDAVAVTFEGRQWTYRQLNERANRLAHYLARRGVGPERLAAVCAERSLEMIVGVLAILKAGGAYVPLDPAAPQKRLEFMLRDTGADLVLTQRRFIERLPPAPARPVCLDADWEQIAGEDAANPLRQISAENLAYVMYTSGSTGAAKAVCIPHRGVVRLVCGTDYVRWGPDQVFLQFAPLAFDASTFEIWGCLLHGARLAVASPQPLSADELGAAIRREGVTTLWLTAGLFHVMVDQRLADLAAVRQLLAGGDVLSPRHVRAFLQAASASVLVNGYGPTENTTFSCCHRMSRPDEVGEPVSIGRPIANTQAYVLDRHLQPVPIGVPGELCLGGAGLARGYLNRPELTARAFVAHPLSDDPDARVYRTGDRVRWRPDGNLEFLGRIDRQVKIRGYRVEPAEVEAVLGQHPEVQEVAVLAREDQPGEKRLVAYWVPRGAPACTESELRDYLRDRLPEYMVPAQFVPLDGLPHSPHGKVDRQSLPAPEKRRSAPTRTRLAPRVPVEQRLAALWARLLGLDPAEINVHDSFFDLGGHSLLAMQLFVQIEKVTGRRLPLATLFEAPTIAQLGAVLSRDGWSPNWSPLTAIHPHGSRSPLFCMHSIGGNVLGFERLAAHLGGDRPVYGLQAVGLDGRQAPHTRVEQMADCYLREILEFQPRGPLFLAGHSFGGLVAFEIARRLRTQGAPVGAVVLFDSYPRPARPRSWAGRLLQTMTLTAKRLGFHCRELYQASAWERVNTLQRSGRTLRRRIRSRLWRTAYRASEVLVGTETRTPAALQTVKECCWLAARHYVPGTYDGRVILFRARERSFTPDDPGERWRDLVTGGIEVHDIPGDHLSLLAEPNVQRLADELRTVLDAAETA
jgi:amino acid adenylation domain-containing protein